MNKKLIIAASLALAWLAAPVHADPYIVDALACSDGNAINGVSTDDVTGNAGGSSDCFGTFDGNDPGPSGDGISIDGMIYEYVTKADISDSGAQTIDGADIGFKIYDANGDCGAPPADGGMSGASATGCWAYDPALFSAGSFVIVLKGANKPGWAAFLFEGGDASSYFGSWAFGWQPNGTACEGNTNKDGTPGSGNCVAVSHISIYAKDGVQMPEPGTLALLGLGLIGLGASRRKKLLK